MNRLTLGIVVAALACGASAQSGRSIVEESQRRTRANSQRYEGTLKVIDARSKVTEKRWVYERLGAWGDSKAVLKFLAPAEVKGVALLILNHKDRASDQWMWTPAIQRERRIALQDRSTRFFGTDFSFEDLEERDADQFDYSLEGEETVNGALCWRLESKPKEAKRSQYTRSKVWIRRDNYLFWQVESFSGGDLVRRLIYADPELAQGIWTAKTLTMHDLKRKSRTELRLERLQYNVALKDEGFTLQALRREQ